MAGEVATLLCACCFTLLITDGGGFGGPDFLPPSRALAAAPFSAAAVDPTLNDAGGGGGRALRRPSTALADGELASVAVAAMLLSTTAGRDFFTVGTAVSTDAPVADGCAFRALACRLSSEALSFRLTF